MLRHLRSHVTLPKSQNPGKMRFVTLLPLLPLFSRPPGGKKILPLPPPLTLICYGLRVTCYLSKTGGGGGNSTPRLPSRSALRKACSVNPTVRVLVLALSWLCTRLQVQQTLDFTG